MLFGFLITLLYVCAMKIIETRGRKPKYDFGSLKKGYYFEVDSKPSTILPLAKRWAEKNNKPYKYATRTVDGIVQLHRIN